MNIVFRYQSTTGFYPRIELDDLIQESFFGMKRAIELFDPSRGFTFSTYAVKWIEQCVRRFIDNTKYMVRVPIYASAIQKQYNKLTDQMSERDEDFYLRLLAFENDMTVEAVQSALKYRGDKVDSIHGVVNEEGEPTIQLETLTWEPETANIDAMFIKKMAKLLPPRDAKIIMLRMENYSLWAIAEELNISRERVRQIQVQALAKLKSMVLNTEEKSYGRYTINERKEIYKTDTESI